MDQMSDASTNERKLFERAKRMHFPINGSLELLPLCNMNCDMCYVRLSREEMESIGRLRTVEEWVSIAREMAADGTLFLLLTGGEPLIYPGFKELYHELKRMGFILTINTNGTLIDEEWADFFARVKPRRINITLYGISDETYGEMCHLPDGFTRVTRGIRLLRERGLDVKVSCSATPANADQLEEMYELGTELDVPVHVDSYMMPATRERKRNFSESSRLEPEKAAETSFRAKRLFFSEDVIRQYVVQSLERVAEAEKQTDGDRHISCMAGNCSYTINWQGEMRPCVVLNHPAVNVFETGFRKAWEEICSRSSKMLISEQCANCRLRSLCRTCVAAGLVETGAYDGVPEYLCRYSERYYELLQEYYKRFNETK